MKKELVMQLEQKRWYRVIKAMAVLLFVVVIVVPLLTGSTNDWGDQVFYSALYATLWFFLIKILQLAIAYIVFGTENKEPGRYSKNVMKEIGSLLYLSCLWLVFLISSLLILSSIGGIFDGEIKNWVSFVLMSTIPILSGVLLYYRLRNKENPSHS